MCLNGGCIYKTGREIQRGAASSAESDVKLIVKIIIISIGRGGVFHPHTRSRVTDLEAVTQTEAALLSSWPR